MEGITLPSPLPFEGVDFYQRPSMRYRSGFDLSKLVEDARNELAEAKPEQFKAFVLAVMAGLRRRRRKGITASNPLHALRKEFGSQVAARHGIYAASRLLRHADIQTTAGHHLDKKQRITVGLGGLLKTTNVVPLNRAEAGTGPEGGETLAD